MARFQNLINKSFIIIVSILFEYSHGANILALFHTPSKSHLLLAQPLFFELVRTGHTVTVVSPFPEKNPPEGYIDVPIPEVIEFTKDHWKTIFEHVNDDYYTIIMRMIRNCATMTNDTLTHPKTKSLIRKNANKKFDLLFIEVFFNDAFLGLADVFDCPVIAMSTVGITPWANDYMGAPTPVSYVHNGMLPFSDRMSLREKLVSFTVTVIERMITHLYHLPKQNAIFKENFPKAIRSLSKLRKEAVSVLFLNSHDSLSAPRSYFKNVVEVGGMQIKSEIEDELPEDIKRFMDEAEFGVVLFAMGSNLCPSLMHNSTKYAILSALASIPQSIILKWDDPLVPVDSKKFLVKKWVPQNLILKHTKTKLLITHGGLLSCFEAVHYAVPILGIPIFGDQTGNVDMAVRGGWGLKMKYTEITMDTMQQSLVRLLENPLFQEGMNNISKLYRGQVVPPLHLAKYWVEYVIEHKGAHHLRTAVLDLKFYQYYNLDLLLVLSTIGLSLMWTVIQLRRKLSCLFNQRVKEKAC